MHVYTLGRKSDVGVNYREEADVLKRLVDGTERLTVSSCGFGQTGAIKAECFGANKFQ